MDDSSDDQNEVSNLTEYNHDDLNLDFNDNHPLPNYSIDTSCSHQVVCRPNKGTDEL